MIGIVILNYNTFTDVCECVSSIEENTHVNYKIYIVDNVSTDNSYERLKKLYETNQTIKVILSDKNGGYSYGNNIGIREAIRDGCEYILISNPDIIYYHTSIDKLQNYLQLHDNVAIVGPSCKSLDSDESQLFRKIYNNKLYIFSKKPFRFAAKVFKSLCTEYVAPKSEEFQFRGMVRGCCFMIRSDIFEKMQLFDANVFLYAEEWILAKKIDKLQMKCACLFSSQVLHKEATSINQKGSAFKTKHLYLSEFYYMKMYNKSSYFMLFVFYISNMSVFFFRSLFNKGYRKLFKSFRKSSNRLMFSNRDFDNEKNKIEL